MSRSAYADEHLVSRFWAGARHGSLVAWARHLQRATRHAWDWPVDLDDPMERPYPRAGLADLGVSPHPFRPPVRRAKPYITREVPELLEE